MCTDAFYTLEIYAYVDITQNSTESTAVRRARGREKWLDVERYGALVS